MIFRFLSERKGLFVLTMMLRLFKEMLPFANPILIGWVVDLLSGTDVSAFGFELFPNNYRSLYTVAGLMAGLAVAKMVFGYIHTLVSAHLGRHVVEAARRDLAEASMQMSLDDRRRFNSGDLLDRSLADSKGLRSFTQNVIIRVFTNTVRAIWPVGFLFYVDWVMALVVMSVIPLQSGLSAFLQRRLQRLTRQSRAAEASHTSAVKESIDGWNSVASVGSQEWITKELRNTASASEDAKIRKKRTTAAISAVISLFTAFGIAACYAIGGWRIISSGAVGSANQDLFTLGDLVAFIGIAKKVYAPFQAYTKIVSSYRTGLVNLERIAEVLDSSMIDPRRNGPDLLVTNGDVELNDMTFSYDDSEEPILNRLSGRIPGRTLTVITGSSGTGKTTLLRLLMGLDQPETGTISVDGQDINIARLASVQSAMSLVPQEPMLFTGTLGENLTLGRNDATVDEMLDACDQADLLQLVRDLPEGLDTEVGSGKHVLSGGQLRRMAIARALLRKPSILLLDEPTTGLDPLTSKQVLDTLRSIAQSTTVIMVSHRRDPLAASDHHLILEDGGWSEGDGNGDRWRPEFAGLQLADGTDERLDDDARPGIEPGAGDDEGLAMATAARAARAAANGANGQQVQQPKGVPSTGRDDPTDGRDGCDGGAFAQAANGHIANPNGTVGDPAHSGVMVDHRALALSAMGRPLTIQTLDKAGARTRVLIVGGHRSSAPIDSSTVDRLVARAASDTETQVSVAAIRSVNPDGAFTDERRTVLGVDISADHQHKVAVETAVFHQAIEQWTPAVIIDVGEREAAQRSSADIEVAVRYDASVEASAPEWLAQLGSEMRRYLRTSRFSADVNLVAADSASVVRATGVPVIEVTAISPPHTAGSERATQAVIEAALAAYQSTALLRPATATTPATVLG